jgi:predicted O-methyltransferase YrrM
MASTSSQEDAVRRVAALEADLQSAWGRYESLRRRKAVRAALAVADLRNRVLRRRPAPAPPAPAPPAPAPPAPEPPEPQVAHPWPLGHFYSPVPDTLGLAEPSERARVWPVSAPALPGIDWRPDAQLALVRDTLAAQERIRFPDASDDPAQYHTGSPQFSAVDAWALQAMLRHVRPRRLVEIGCGWSSLVTAQVNREYLDGRLDVTCIEPYPPEFLHAGIEGIGRVLVRRVQDAPLEIFEQLGAGDVLFIDSSHVVKTGSDARFLYHEVLPRLAPGVVVHAHDIFLPRDYPEDWVFAGRGWNEQYVLQSFLQFNAAFEVLLGLAWLRVEHPDVLEAAGLTRAEQAGGAGSFWMRRIAA